jgi:putative phosphoribosyl transferase
MPFRDRSHAGRQLAKALQRYRDQQPVVLALPRGGVPVAAEVSAALHAPLDLVIVRKIGVPIQPELAMGAVAEGPEPLIIRNEDVIRLVGVTNEEFASVCVREWSEIERRRRRYLRNRPRADVEDRTAIVIDDGIATGATTRAALSAVRARKPKELVLAVPVAPPATLEALRDAADEIVCLETPEPFDAIGLFYRDFSQVSDQDVIDILARHQTQVPAS